MAFYVQDGMRTTHLLTNSSGAVTDRFAYDAFGELIEHQGTTVDPYLFAGEWFDSATGHYNLRACDYAPATGRFTQADPLRGTDPSLLNQYVYVHGDPVNFALSEGHEALAARLDAAGVAELLDVRRPSVCRSAS